MMSSQRAEPTGRPLPWGEARVGLRCQVTQEGHPVITPEPRLRRGVRARHRWWVQLPTGELTGGRRVSFAQRHHFVFEE